MLAGPFPHIVWPGGSVVAGRGGSEECGPGVLSAAAPSAPALCAHEWRASAVDAVMTVCVVLRSNL